jgi:hypothetical protein
VRNNRISFGTKSTGQGVGNCTRCLMCVIQHANISPAITVRTAIKIKCPSDNLGNISGCKSWNSAYLSRVHTCRMAGDCCRVTSHWFCNKSDILDSNSGNEFLLGRIIRACTYAFTDKCIYDWLIRLLRCLGWRVFDSRTTKIPCPSHPHLPRHPRDEVARC